MKKTFLLATTFAIFTFISTALAEAPKPAACPSANMISHTDFYGVSEYQGKYYAFQKNNYDTPETWEFSMAVEATSTFSALLKAKIAVASLSGNPSPKYYAQADVWYCVYRNLYNELGIALTPLKASTSMQLAQLMK